MRIYSNSIMMENDMESGTLCLGAYQDKPKVFPNMRTKLCTPLILRILLCINVRVLFVILLLGLGAIFYLGASTSPIIVFVISVCILSFLVATYLTKWVLAKDEGPPEMVQIADAIREGAEGFFKTQYGSVSMAILLAVVILCIYLFGSTTPQQESSGLGRSTSAYIIVASFLLGALCSGIAGYVGMWVSVRANVRVSSAARRSAREALQVATRAGGLSALIVVGMAAIGIAVLYATFYVWLGVDSPGSMKVTDLPLLLVGYGFGASFVALFAQLGGGIYTKAADVGADLVGKVEQGIPEDNPRNPAVITDLDEVEADVRRLRLELKQTMEMYSSACKEALTAKQNLLELHNWRIEEEKKLEFVALVAQLGCGIYTKAADVGADHVGKVEQGIPEDEPRNPAVIADLDEVEADVRRLRLELKQTLEMYSNACKEALTAKQMLSAYDGTPRR